MRKLAPAVLMTSMLALAGSAFANSADKVKTDNITGSPTVSANKATATDLSYSDKSNTSPGTNAKMDKAKKKNKAKADATAGVTMDTTVSTPEASADTSAPMASPAPIIAPTPTASEAAKSNETTGLSPQ